MLIIENFLYILLLKKLSGNGDEKVKKLLEDYYPENRFQYIMFDIFLGMFMMAYFIFYQDGFGTIRLISTFGVLLFGCIIAIPTWQYVNQYTCWYAIFFIYGFVSLAWAKNSTQITSITITLIRVLFISYFLGKRIKREEDIDIIFNLYLITILVLDLYVGKKMVDLYALKGLINVRFGDNFAFNSNTISVGNIIAILIIVYKILNKRKSVIYFLLMFFYFVIALLTQSKKGIIGLIFGAVLYLYYKGKTSRKRIGRICVAIIFVLIAFQLLLNIPFLYETVGHRLTTFIGGANVIDISTRNREELMKFAINLWINHPIFGVGLNNFSIFQTVGGSGYYAHNNYLEILADLGIIGFMLYYWMPMKLALKKIDFQSDLQVILKVITIVLLFFDLGSVTYQDIRVQLFFMLQYLLHFNGVLYKGEKK